MKILSPREYKLEHPDAYLEDYLAYLEKEQNEAEETLKSAQKYKLDPSFIQSIEDQVEEIFKMVVLVEEYMAQVILKTVDTLTLEELQSYFNFDDDDKLSEEEKVSLEEERKSIQVRLGEIEKQIESDLYANGRVKEFYEVEDAKQFFTANIKTNEFVEGLLSALSALSVDSAFATVAVELTKQLTEVIETECRIQNIELSPQEVHELCDQIMELFKEFKNILKRTPGAKEQVASIALSEDGIKKILPEAFDENTAEYLINDLMNLKKLKTTFYTNLPDGLKNKLANERLQGEDYGTLLRTYQAFLNGEELPSDDLSQEEKAEKKSLEGRIETISNKMVSIDADKESRQEFLVNEDAMRASLREQILEIIGDQVTAKDIDDIIKEEETRIEGLTHDLEKASKELSGKRKDVKRAKEILLDQDYHYFFQSVELNNVRRIYRFFGVNVTEEVILPFLEEERRRYDQLDIMIKLQNKLCDIYDEIQTKKKKSNIVSRNLPAYKQSLRELDEKYQEAIRAALKELKEKGLCYIDIPQISDESTIGNVILLPAVRHPEPSELIDLAESKQTFWNMATGIDENTKRKFLDRSSKFDNWDDYYHFIMQEQSDLVNKVFNFEKGSDDYYVFASTKDERERLRHLQKLITEILSSIYEERRAFRRNLGEHAIPLNYEKEQELEYFLGKGANLSRENLANYIEQTEYKIAELEGLIKDNSALCVRLGIKLPSDISQDEVVEAPLDSDIIDGTIKIDDIIEQLNPELVEKIKALNIDGVDTYEAAVAYRNTLLEIIEYKVPEIKVKSFVSEHKKKN